MHVSAELCVGDVVVIAEALFFDELLAVKAFSLARVGMLAGAARPAQRQMSCRLADGNA